MGKLSGERNADGVKQDFRFFLSGPGKAFEVHEEKKSSFIS
jgi:hypothetical protein